MSTSVTTKLAGNKRKRDDEQTGAHSATEPGVARNKKQGGSNKVKSARQVVLVSIVKSLPVISKPIYL